MENSSLSLPSQSLIKENDEEDRDKENINVVIVPESILQAIKSSSNLSLNVSGSPTHNKQTQDDNCQNLPTIESSIVSDSNFRISFANDCYNNDDNVKLENVCNAENLEERCQNTTSLSVDSSSVENAINENSNFNQCGLLQNCIILPFYFCALLPSFFSDGATGVEHESTSTDTTATQNALSRPYVVMQVQSVENEGDKSIYTLAPASSVESLQQFNNLPVTSENWTPTTPAETPTKNTENSPLFLSSLPIISHQQTVKHCVATTDRATHTSGFQQPHKCEVENCNKVFTSYSQYRKHKTTVHEKKKPYKCKYANCLWSFQTPYKLKRHLESHYKHKPFSCSYPGCNAVFSNEYNLQAHRKVHLQGPKTFICKICGEVTPNKRKLESHMYKIHNEGRSFSCNICGKKCLTSAALVIHKRTHNPKLKLECPLCDKTFTKLYYLKTHLYQHTGERPYECDKCGWGFTSQSNLNRHMLTHSEKKRFKCSHKNCDKEVNRLDHLFHHLRSKQHKEGNNNDTTIQQHYNIAAGKEQQYFQCEACADVFLTHHGLKRHQQSCKQHVVLTAELNSEEDCASDEDQVVFNKTRDSKNSAVSVDNVIKDVSPRGSSLSKVLNVGTPDKVEFKSSSFDVRATLNDSCSLSPASLQVEASADPLTDINGDWNTNVDSTESSKNENINDTQYLNFQSQESETQVPLGPFIMEDISVLNDAATHNFLQLNDDITACVSDDSVAVASDEAEQSGNADVLQRYVVDLNSLDSMININENFVIQQQDGHHNSDQCEEASSKSLFNEGIQLPSIEDTSTLDSTAHFSGTTLNLNDIH